MPLTPSRPPTRGSRSPNGKSPNSAGPGTPRNLNINPRSPRTTPRQKREHDDQSPRKTVRARIWLLLLAGSVWSVFALHKSTGKDELSSLLQKEMEQEAKYLATLFRKASQDAQALLDGHLISSQPSNNNNLRQLGQNQSAFLISSSQPAEGEATAQTSVQQYSHYSVDFAKLDPQRHHAIVIPYRDRKYHLEQFIEHMGPYLRRNFPDDTFELWIVEQDDPHLFNRAWLANVGIANIKLQNRNFKYQLAQKQAQEVGATVYVPITVPPPPKCIILHDVDLIPTVDGVPYTNCTRPMQLGSELAHFNNSIPYPIYTGGVGPTMIMEHWVKINGMSNDFYGWGGEDDELWHRLRLNGLLKQRKPRPIPPPDKHGRPYRGPKFWPPEIERPPKGRGKFRPISEAETVHHNNKSHNQWNRIGYMLELMQNNSARWTKDGLSDLKMTITGDAMTVTHLDTIVKDNTTLQTDPSVMSTSKAATTTLTKQHYISGKQPGSIVSSLSIEPTALASFAAVHHIKAIPKLTALEFVHVTQTDGSLIERAGAGAGIAWGACHFRHALEKEMRCPDIVYPEWEGNTRMQPGLQTHDPWHSPLQDFEENPYRGRPTFAVVRNPYHRLIEFYFCPWNGYKGTKIGPESLNAFIQSAMKEEKPEKEGEPPPPTLAFLHLRPQFHYIFASNKIAKHSKPFVTHILRHEHLEEDFKRLMHMYNLDNKVQLPTTPMKQPKQRPLQLTPADFSDETLEIIHEFYAGDFGRFKYRKINRAEKIALDLPKN